MKNLHTRLLITIIFLCIIFFLNFQVFGSIVSKNIFDVANNDQDIYIGRTESTIGSFAHQGGLAVADVNGDGIKDFVATAIDENVTRFNDPVFLPENKDDWTESDSLSLWFKTASSHSSKPIMDTTIYSIGGSSISTTRTGKGTAGLAIAFPNKLSPDYKTGIIHFQVYVQDSNEKLVNIRLRAPNFDNRFIYTFNPNLKLVKNTWIEINIPLSEFTVEEGEPDWNNTISATINFSGGESGDIKIDQFYLDYTASETKKAGIVYLFYGPISGVKMLHEADVFIYGINTGDLTGEYLDVKDVNGDGYGDIIIGSPFYDGIDNTRADSGLMQVVFGRKNLSRIIDLKYEADFTVYGADQGDLFGESVHTSDLNNDGIQDLIIGAQNALGINNKGIGNGEIHIIYGNKTLGGILDLNLSSADISIYGQNYSGLSYQSTIGAGDINNNGMKDLIFGANNRIFVIYDISKYTKSIDLEVTSPDLIIYAGDNGDHLVKVTIGDFNNDGIDDIIAGADKADGLDNLKPDVGELYVIYGSSSLPLKMYLNVIKPDVRIIGMDTGDSLGTKIYAGDLNNDGIDDISVIVPGGGGADNSKSESGEVYVLYGNSNHPETIDLSVSSPDVIVYGADSDDDLRDIYCADITNDGVNDLIMGFRNGDGLNNAFVSWTGEIIVINGNRVPKAVIEKIPPTILDVTPKNNVIGIRANTTISVNFSEIIDTTSITLDTFILSDGRNNILGSIVKTLTKATFTPNVNLNNNSVYTVTITNGVKDIAGNNMVFKKTWSFTTSVNSVCKFDISNKDEDIYISRKSDIGTFANQCGTSVGDINGDGINDFVTSAVNDEVVRLLPMAFFPSDKDMWTESKSLNMWYTIPASNSSTPVSDSSIYSEGTSSISISRTGKGTTGFLINFPSFISPNSKTDTLHFKVYAQDFNEKIGVIRFRAPDYDNRFVYNVNTKLKKGEWVQFDIPLSKFEIEDGVPGWNAISSISISFFGGKSGDIKIDQFYFDYTGPEVKNAGIAYLSYGPLSDIKMLDESDVFIYGIDAGDLTGDSLKVKDINGDGYGDIIIGTPYDDGPDNSRIDAGAVYVVFGKKSLPKVIDLKNSADLIIYGIDSGDLFGISVDAVDINKDNLSDLIIGAQNGNGYDNKGKYNGEIHIIYSYLTLGGIIDLNSKNADISIYGKVAYDFIGAKSTIGVGDIYNDGQKDLIFGGYGGSREWEGQFINAGKIIVLNNISNLNGAIDLVNTIPSTVIYGANNGDLLTKVAIGDFNDDGVDDIIAGADKVDAIKDGKSDIGEINVFYGSSSLSSKIYLNFTNPDIRINGMDLGDNLGAKIFAEDINNDGIDDISVIAPSGEGANNNKTKSGEVYVFYGHSNYSNFIDLNVSSPDVIIYGADEYDNLKDIYCGDITGDGLNDLLISFRNSEGLNNSYSSGTGEIVVINGNRVSGAIKEINPPKIISVIPENNLSTIDIDTSISVYFSEIMDTTSITHDTFKVKNGNSNLQGTITKTGTKVSFIPLNNLSYLTNYMVIITNGVKDFSGNNMLNEYTISFTTKKEEVVPVEVKSDKKKKSTCVITSFVNKSHSVKFKRIRDSYFSVTPIGKAIVDIYYEYSPAACKLFKYLQK